MAKLLTAVPINVSAGTYNLKMDMSSGDARLQYSVDNEDFTDIIDSVQTSNSSVAIELPGCRLQSVITGDANVYLTMVRR